MNEPWTDIKALSVTSVSMLFLAPRFYNLAILTDWKTFLTTASFNSNNSFFCWNNGDMYVGLNRLDLEERSSLFPQLTALKEKLLFDQEYLFIQI